MVGSPLIDGLLPGGVGIAGGAYGEGSADRPVHSGTGGRVTRRGEAPGMFYQLSALTIN